MIGDGKLDIINEAEIPYHLPHLLQLGLERFQIRVNNRKILNGFYAMAGLAEQSQDVMRTVDKLDKIGAEKVKLALMEDVGVDEATAGQVLNFIAIRGSNQEVLAALEGYRGRNELFDTGLDELTTVVKYLGGLRGARGKLRRGPHHRPGPGLLHRHRLRDHHAGPPRDRQRLLRQRYDNLAEFYTDKQLPGVGISIGLTRLFYVLGEQDMLNLELPTAPADVLVIPMDGGPAGLRHRHRHQAAGGGHPHPALRREEEVQGQDHLRLQAGDPLRPVPGRDRGAGTRWWP